ncbi:hypothetical protein [Saliphagus sp. LR7]|uniref:hypothetical protein n=1 Tax=Saliphagus sp. LR7 TaxID=2282654 RepID=UPI000DF7E560|nr:hypothetical protein [Saliphagus sp. LR7]
MSDKTKRVNLAISEGKKERWEEYHQNNPELQSMADLVRTAVEREIAREENETPVESGASDQKVAQILDKMDLLSDRMKSFEGRLKNIEERTTTNPEINRLKGEIYEILPDEKPGSEGWEDEVYTINKAGGTGTTKGMPDGWEGTPEALADALDEPIHLVEEAVEKLEEASKSVWMTEDGEYYIRR